MVDAQQSLNALCRQFLGAITAVDCPMLGEIASDAIAIDVPGARSLDITEHGKGINALCEWATTVHRECGPTVFDIHRYFENGCELMANGAIHIERLPRVFKSPCALHIRVEAGKIMAFQLLLDTYALEKFRGEMD